MFWVVYSYYHFNTGVICTKKSLFSTFYYGRSIRMVFDNNKEI